MMSMRKITIITGVVLSLALSAGFAGAAMTCRGVTLTKAGARADTTTKDLVVYLKCADTWTNARFYYLQDGMEDAAYATALTAIATGKTVDVELSTTTNGSLINFIEINN